MRELTWPREHSSEQISAKVNLLGISVVPTGRPSATEPPTSNRLLPRHGKALPRRPTWPRLGTTDDASPRGRVPGKRVLTLPLQRPQGVVLARVDAGEIVLPRALECGGRDGGGGARCRGRGARSRGDGVGGTDGAHLEHELTQKLLRKALGKVGRGLGRLEVLLGPLQEEPADRRPLIRLAPHPGDKGRAGDLARALLDLLHALERLVAEPVDLVLLAELPQSEEVLVGRNAAVIGPDLVGVHEVLGQAEDAGGGLGDLDHVLDHVVGRVVEVFLKVARDGAEEVLLQAEWDLVRANHDDHEDRVWLSGLRVSCDDVRAGGSMGRCGGRGLSIWVNS